MRSYRLERRGICQSGYATLVGLASRSGRGWATAAGQAGLLLCLGLSVGCGSVRQWWHNGWRVGPDYGRPAAQVADNWLEAADPQLVCEATDYSQWWAVFDDPELDGLIRTAYDQNLPLQIAGMRIFEARAQRGVAGSTLWPQSQQAFGAYSRNKFSGTAYPFGDFPLREEYDDWISGFDAAWELDIWGRFRRGIEASEANLNAQIENYDDVLVMLQADVAATYIQMRTLEQRLALARTNAQLQQNTLQIIEQRLAQGVSSQLDVRQARSILRVTESMIPMFEENLRKTHTALCILLGVPPRNLAAELPATGRIPLAPPTVVVGIPADLLRRRPDVQRAERQAAAQCAAIGIAEAEFYPHIAITGTVAVNAQHFGDLFAWDSLTGKVGPGFRWNILNYGRIRNNVRAEEAKFQQAALAYQQTVLMANKEAEDAIASYLREQQRVKLLAEAAEDTKQALQLGLLLYEQGVVDYQRVLDASRALVVQQDALAESEGKVALNLIAVYKAMGGGWQMRFGSGGPGGPPADTAGGQPIPATAAEPGESAAPLPVPPTVPGVDVPPVPAPRPADNS